MQIPIKCKKIIIFFLDYKGYNHVVIVERWEKNPVPRDGVSLGPRVPGAGLGGQAHLAVQVGVGLGGWA